MGNITHAHALIPTVRGNIKVSIQQGDKKYSISVTVPKNTKCEVYLPDVYPTILCDGKVVKAKKQQGYNSVIVGAGTFQFVASK